MVGDSSPSRIEKIVYCVEYKNPFIEYHPVTRYEFFPNGTIIETFYATTGECGKVDTYTISKEMMHQFFMHMYMSARHSTGYSFLYNDCVQTMTLQYPHKHTETMDGGLQLGGKCIDEYVHDVLDHISSEK